MTSFIYKHSERNNEEYKELLMRRLFPKEIPDSSFSSNGSLPGIQIDSMNQHHISDRDYPFDHIPTFTPRDLNRLFKSNQ